VGVGDGTPVDQVSLGVGAGDRIPDDVDIGITRPVFTKAIVLVVTMVVFAMVKRDVDVGVLRLEVRLEGGACTVEKAGSLIFCNLVNEKAWPSCSRVVFLLNDSRPAPWNSRWYAPPFARLLR
jgi:hypothetical protein